MQPWRGLIALLAFAAFAGQAAVVYKWTDAQGVVHYSDQPVPGAVKIITNSTSPNSVAPAPVGANTAARPPAKSPRSNATALDYSVVAIESPTPEQTFFASSVNVRLHLEPPLKEDQTVIFYLNGQPVENQAPTATQITLEDLPRGSYAVSASITDSKTQQSLSSESVTFYMRQPSSLSLQHK
jgi:hypothetical protein